MYGNEQKAASYVGRTHVPLPTDTPQDVYLGGGCAIAAQPSKAYPDALKEAALRKIAPPPATPNDIPFKLEHVGHAIDRLAAGIAALEDRMLPVLRPGSGPATPNGPVEAASCQLHEQLIYVEGRVLEYARRVEELAERLAL